MSLLLPLGAWAETNIKDAQVHVQSIEYGGYSLTNPNTLLAELNVLVTLDAQLTKDEHYTVDGAFYTDAACTTPVKNGNENITDFKKLPIGDYYVKISGIGVFNGFTSGSFSVTKRTLTVSVMNPAFFVKDYKQADPTLTGAVLWNGEGDAPAKYYQVAGLVGTDVIGNVLTVSSPGYSYGNVVDANANTEGVILEGKAGYSIDYTGFSLKTTGAGAAGGNYNLVFAERVMKIKQISMAAAEVVRTSDDAADHVYSGVAYKPTYTIKYRLSNGTDGIANTDDDVYYSLVASDYDLKYYDGETLVADPTDVATAADGYEVKAVGKGNFTGTFNMVDQFKITKAALNILLNSDTKVYDGVAYTAANAKYTITGLVSRDEGKVTGLSVTPAPDFASGVGNYNVNLNATAAKVVYSTTSEVALDKNYTINGVGNTWAITARPIVISAADRTAVKGGDVPDSELSVSGNIKSEGEGQDKTTILDAFKIVKKDGLSTAAFATTNDAYTPTRKVAADYASEGDAKVTAADLFLANYSIHATTGIVKGKLTVGAANLAIIPSINSSIEYNTDFATGLGYITLSGDPLAPVTDAVEPATTGGKITYEYKVAGADDNTYSATVPTAIGSYNVRVVKSSVKGKGAYASVAADKFTCTPAQFSIVPKAIAVTINNVTLAKSSTVETLNAHATVVAGWDAGVKKGEKLEFNFKFDPAKVGADKVLAVATDGKISRGGAFVDDNDAIIAELKEGAYNDNYAVTFTPGDLIFGASELVLNPKDAALATKISEAAATGEKYDVTFDQLTMKANEWYAMVLPFEVDPKEMVYAVDRYVIFNELNVAGTTAGNFKFTLKFEPIPAGTPFLIKFAGDADDIIDFGEMDDNDTPEDDTDDFKIISFDGVKISAAIKPTEKEGILTFTGTYASDVELQGSRTNGSENYVWWLCDTRYERSTRVNDWLKPISKSHKVAPMEAWLDGNESAWTGYAPIITVEDFDGQTTAIKTLNAEKINNLNVVTEGWYTLNGVKLNAAPTQKGIYINNGKKVVIK